MLQDAIAEVVELYRDQLESESDSSEDILSPEEFEQHLHALAETLLQVFDEPMAAYFMRILGEHLNDEDVETYFERIHSEFEPILDERSQSIFQILQERLPDRIAEEQTFSKGFEERLAEVWGGGLGLLNIILILAREFGGDFNKQCRPEAIKSNDLIFEALTRLHARACLVGSEILALLRSGHAMGAFARWRTLHEISVIALFIAKHDQDTAERYLLHEAIHAYEGAQEYQKYASQLGLQSFTEQEMRDINQRYDQLKKQYGDFYHGKFGWARAAYLADFPEHRGGLSLQLLEEAMEMDHWRPYYRSASLGIHPSSRAILYTIGVADLQDSVLLAGPSNAGLADPGICTCLTLVQVTTWLLNHKPNAQRLMMLKVLQMFTDVAQKAFLEAHETIEAKAHSDEQERE
jgi:hypothetical protein